MNERLKQIREEQKMNQSEFAKKLGMGQSTLAMLEVGKRDILDRHIKTVCSIFDVSEDWLRTGQGEMYIETKQSFLEKLSGEYGLSFTAQKIIECYLNLGEEQRTTVDGFIHDIANSLTEKSVDDKAMPAAVVDNVIKVYRAADSSSGKEHGVVPEALSEIERMKQAPRITHDDDF